MKISIITTTYNSAKTIEDTLKSVVRQDYFNIEHIIIDGGSLDETLKIVAQYPSVSKVISEPDKGIYDAMNKGLKLASGDIIGILNSDDFFASNNIISNIVQTFTQNKVDCVFGDVDFVRPDNLNKVVRHYSSAYFYPALFAYGFMPAHPSFFVYKRIYEQYGYFKTDYKIAADYELLIRFLYSKKISYQYIPLTVVKMRTGGASNRNLKSNLLLNQETMRASRENNISTNYLKIYSKYFIKIFQLLKR